MEKLGLAEGIVALGLVGTAAPVLVAVAGMVGPAVVAGMVGPAVVAGMVELVAAAAASAAELAGRKRQAAARPEVGYYFP